MWVSVVDSGPSFVQTHPPRITPDSKPGATLALTGRNEAALARVTQACEARGARVLSKAADVSDREALATWIQAVDGASPLDLVVVNAGVTATTLGLDSPAKIEAATRGIFDAK